MEQEEMRTALLHKKISIGQTVTGTSRRYGWSLSVEEIAMDEGLSWQLSLRDAKVRIG